MSRIALTSSLNDYAKLPIKKYKDRLKGDTPKQIEVSYHHKGKDYHYPIKLTATSCHYGGYRYWWHCPKCSKRVGVLYCAGVYVCRHCIGANYQSQLSQPLDKLTDKLYKIRAKLGWQAGIAQGHGNRPKGMHQRTFNRLVIEYQQLELKILGQQSAHVQKIYERLEKMQ